MAGQRRKQNYTESPEIELSSGKYDNFEKFAEKYLYIQTKAGELSNFALNKSQKIRESLITEMEEKGVPVRVWEAKARQLGCSTHIQGRMFWRCVTNRDETALVAAHADPAVHSIFTKSKVFYDNLPSELKPLTKYNNRAELDFRAPSGPLGLRSRFVVMTAKSTEDARSATARNVHCSEVAFYKRPEEFFLATLQTVPDEPGTTVYVESTCRGTGDFHHTMYLNAKLWWDDDPPPWMELKKKYPGNPDSEWYALFTPWFLMDEYKSKLKCSEKDFIASLDYAETELLNKFGEWVTLEHLQWRRQSIMTKCGGSIDRFHQEYPSTDEEAFSTSGSPVFDRTALESMEVSSVCWCDICKPYAGAEKPDGNTCPEHKWYEILDGTPRSDSSYTRKMSSITPILTETTPGAGRMSVWKEPKRGSRYIVSADISKGPISKDWDHVVVWDVGRMEQVAEWRGKIELDQFADICILIALHYNKAVLAPEATGIGAGVIAMIERAGYWNLYRRRTVDSWHGSTGMLGWDTNQKTKPVMVGLAQRAIKESYSIVRSRSIYNELRSYMMTLQFDAEGRELEAAKFTAPSGKHDDACVAFMIANAVAHYSPGHGTGKGPMVGRNMLLSQHWNHSDWDEYEKMHEKQLKFTLGKRR